MALYPALLRALASRLMAEDEAEDLEKGKFGSGDAGAKHKGLNSKQKSKWAQVANAVQRDTGDEVQAIKAANSVINELPKNPSMKVKNKPNKKK